MLYKMPNIEKFYNSAICKNCGKIFLYKKKRSNPEYCKDMKCQFISLQVNLGLRGIASKNCKRKDEEEESKE